MIADTLICVIKINMAEFTVMVDGEDTTNRATEMDVIILRKHKVIRNSQSFYLYL